MDRYSEKLIEEGSGIGLLIDTDGEVFDEIDYDYQIFQKFIYSTTLSGSSTIPGLKRLEGRITLINKREEILGKVFTLETSDGKKWRILFHSGDFLSGTYIFVKAAE